MQRISRFLGMFGRPLDTAGSVEDPPPGLSPAFIDPSSVPPSTSPVHPRVASSDDPAPAALPRARTPKTPEDPSPRLPLDPQQPEVLTSAQPALPALPARDLWRPPSITGEYSAPTSLLAPSDKGMIKERHVCIYITLHYIFLADAFVKK